MIEDLPFLPKLPVETKTNLSERQVFAEIGLVHNRCGFSRGAAKRSRWVKPYLLTVVHKETYIGTILARHGLVLSGAWLYTHLHVEIKFPVSGCEGLCAGCCSVRKSGFRR